MEEIDQLVNQIHDAGIYAPSSDKKVVVSNKEQLAGIIRFVDDHGRIREVFMGFIGISGSTNREAIANGIKSPVSSCPLELGWCRDQTCGDPRTEQLLSSQRRTSWHRMFIATAIV